MILLMMRSYFCIDLKGKSLFLPFLAAWAAAVGGTLLFLRFAERYASPEPLLDWSFAAFAVCCLLFVVVMQAACCFALYFFVRATAGGSRPITRPGVMRHSVRRASCSVR